MYNMVYGYSEVSKTCESARSNLLTLIELRFNVTVNNISVMTGLLSERERERERENRTEQNRTDYLFDVNYTVSSQSNTIIIIYISRSQILLKCLNQVVVLI